MAATWISRAIWPSRSPWNKSRFVDEISAAYTRSMARLDQIHNAVKSALIKDGWTITHDPYKIHFEEVKLYADLAAERPIAAQRGTERIVVEVKSFIGPSLIHDLELALGQYDLYLSFLEVTEPDRKLYLAVSDLVYDTFFGQRAIQHVIERRQLAIMVVNVDAEEIVKWTN